MSGKVSVDVGRLREAAHALGGVPEAPRSVTVGMGDLGSAQMDASFEAYYPTWSSECSTAEHSVRKLSAMLGSAADTYARRDAQEAHGFAGGLHAF